MLRDTAHFLPIPMGIIGFSTTSRRLKGQVGSGRYAPKRGAGVSGVSPTSDDRCPCDGGDERDIAPLAIQRRYVRSQHRQEGVGYGLMPSITRVKAINIIHEGILERHTVQVDKQHVGFRGLPSDGGIICLHASLGDISIGIILKAGEFRKIGKIGYRYDTRGRDCSKFN